MTDITPDDLRARRLAAGWSVPDACRELRGVAPDLPALDSLIRSWRRWESGARHPNSRYRRLLADLFAAPTGGPDGRSGPRTSMLTVWRRWLAFELRRVREEAGLDRAAVAEACGWQPSKLDAVENGQQAVTAEDLDRLLPLYRVPQDRWQSYHEAIDNSRGLGWWQRYEEQDVPRWLSLYVGLEQGASRLRAYEPQIVHGLLQTADYAAAVIRRDPAARAEEQVARLVGVRTARQAALTRAVDPLNLWAVLDEAALHRVVGNPPTMAAQLAHVAELAERRPNVTVQVVPFAEGAHGATSGAFALLGFPWATDAGVAYGEYRTGAVYCEAFREVEEHALVFQQLCALALPPDESARLIRRTAEEYARAPVS